MDAVAGLDHFDAIARRLLDDYQRDFPLVSRPYAEIARALHIEQGEVIERLARLRNGGYISRIGPVFRPRRIGSSTLAAVSVPEHRLEEAAAIINGYTEVNHNYAREHELNLWFVATAPTPARLQTVLESIEKRCRTRVLSLPLEREFRIDLGFPLWSGDEVAPGACHDASGLARRPAERMSRRDTIAPRSLQEPEHRLVASVQDGLALTPRPFARIGAELEESETSIVRMLRTLLADGFIRRFGVVVRHHELGYRANAMVVWDVPDELVVATGERLSRYRGVTLCYQRPRRPPRWPYNLFCMVHGRSRGAVVSHITSMRRRCGLARTPYDILFSRRRYKQRGARYTLSNTELERIGQHG